MKGKRFSEEQIIKVLKEAETGKPVPDLCRLHGISQQSYHRWKSKYGGMDVSEARRLRDRPLADPPTDALRGSESDWG